MLEYSKALTADDFFTGIFTGLAALGQRTVSLRGNRFDLAMKTVFERMRQIAPEQELGFHIQPHPQHGDSPTVREGIINAARRGIVSLETPFCREVHLRVAPCDSTAYLQNLLGGPQVYLRLARTLMDVYPGGVS